jgi:regulator of protease activity HflC (stomatin/prohibitin superfamily)
MIIPLLALLVAVAVFCAFGLTVVRQGTVAVITTFGKYTRIMRAGLGFYVPFIQKVQSRISVQNRSMELSFQAITQDQANVYFKAMLLFSVTDDNEETIKRVAFKFINEAQLTVALVRTVEAITRGFVATKKQSEILGLRAEIISEAKSRLDDTLAEWGYHLIDLQLNDITFDDVITASMAKVVASQNLQRAAVNEGEALYIMRTKEAEAEGAAIKIAAEAEALAAKRRGEGVRMFREEVASGLAEAAKTVNAAGADEALVMFAMWTETIRDTAERGKGNVIFLDGSISGMEQSIRHLIGMQHPVTETELTQNTAAPTQKAWLSPPAAKPAPGPPPPR